MEKYTTRALRPEEEVEMEALLHREGIRRDAGLDYSCGVFDGETLVATGSCAGNSLRCFAVAHEHRGEGLTNRLLQHLIHVQYDRGNFHIFLYTKPQNALLFQNVGFSEITRARGAVFMENRKTGFPDYLIRLHKDAEVVAAFPGPVGALVMNANPFTLGHRYLAECASRDCGLLHLFVVSEDASLFPAADRMELVRQGVAHLRNVVLHPTDSYLISNASFPAYFLPDEEAASTAQAELDAAVFSRIADALSIQVRFLGEEPSSAVTRLYNQVLTRSLPEHGIDCRVLPRLRTKGGSVISASTVREALRMGDWTTTEEMVPASTLAYLRSEKGAEVTECLRAMENVKHH